MATQHLQNLPKDGKSGEWTFSVAEKGFINRDLFLQVLKDFDHFLTLNDIPRPVILFLDGASPHISLAAAEFCITHNIQCWLFKPNFTHLLQPLDLSFFASLKKELKKLAWSWQTTPSNTGQALSKYSVIGVLHSAVENCLNKENCVVSGFRRAGLYPWNPNAPDRSKLNPSKVYQVPVSAPNPQNETGLITLTAVDGSSSPSPDAIDSSPTCASNPLPLVATSSPSPDVSMPPPPGVSSSPQTGLSTSPPLEVSSFPTSLPTGASMSSPPSGSTSPLPYEVAMAADISETSPPPYAEDILLSDITNFDPPMSSTLISEEQNQTYRCPMCHRRILNRFEEIHLKNCRVPLAASESLLDPSLQLPPVFENPEHSTHKLPIRLPTFSSEDRKNHLLKFEVLLLSPEQTQEFNEMLEKGYYCAEPLYSSWLALKVATIPTEDEALNLVLSSHTAENVPKRAKKRNVNVPVGPMRYDPSSSAWVEILKETEAKKIRLSEKKKTPPASEKKKTPPTKKDKKKNPAAVKKVKTKNIR